MLRIRQIGAHPKTTQTFNFTHFGAIKNYFDSVSRTYGLSLGHLLEMTKFLRIFVGVFMCTCSSRSQRESIILLYPKLLSALTVRYQIQMCKFRALAKYDAFQYVWSSDPWLSPQDVRHISNV